MRESAGELLSQHTTLRLGGPARRLLEVTNTTELLAALRQPGPQLLLGGGSNIVISDNGFDGTVILIRSRGIQFSGETLTIEAGHPWDDVVQAAIAEGLAGLETLSGIPGSAGGAPVYNIGGYGLEITEKIASVEIYDRQRDVTEVWPPNKCGFTFRNSLFKKNNRYVILRFTLQLTSSPITHPTNYSELVDILDIRKGDQPPIQEVRDAVLELRRRKSMLLDPNDPDSYSVGAFFTNPTMTIEQADRLFPTAPRWPGDDDTTIKIPAGWFISQAGFPPGYEHNGVGISTKHPSALTNRGTGTTTSLLALAAEITAAVQKKFGITLENEPIIIP